jgi:asparagine synthase (glutamine-hydrolysing)
MCGICGEIRFDGRSADVTAVSRMTGAMVPRGPDSDGVVAHGPVALGHRRLSIIDLSPSSFRPARAATYPRSGAQTSHHTAGH